jgi:hypothetical protein
VLAASRLVGLVDSFLLAVVGFTDNGGGRGACFFGLSGFSMRGKINKFGLLTFLAFNFLLLDDDAGASGLVMRFELLAGLELTGGGFSPLL